MCWINCRVQQPEKLRMLPSAKCHQRRRDWRWEINEGSSNVDPSRRLSPLSRKPPSRPLMALFLPTRANVFMLNSEAVYANSGSHWNHKCAGSTDDWRCGASARPVVASRVSSCLLWFFCRAAPLMVWRSRTAWRLWACLQQTHPSSAERCPRGNASGKRKIHRRLHVAAGGNSNQPVANTMLVNNRWTEVSRHPLMLTIGLVCQMSAIVIHCEIKQVRKERVTMAPFGCCLLLFFPSLWPQSCNRICFILSTDIHGFLLHIKLRQNGRNWVTAQQHKCLDKPKAQSDKAENRSAASLIDGLIDWTFGCYVVTGAGSLRGCFE